MTDIKQRPVTIGVAGGTGSGKTTISQHLIDRVGQGRVAYLPHDSYYKDLCDMPKSVRDQANFDHPDALDTHILTQNVRDLQDMRPTRKPIYDFTRHLRKAETETVQPQPVILVEGILIFAEAELRDLFDIKIFVDTDADIRFIRRLLRDIEERQRSTDSVVQQYLDTVRPMHLKFVEPSKRYADVIIPEGGYNWVAVDLIASRILNMLDVMRG
jgi:uridine kinase